MKIININKEPIDLFPYLTVGRGGRDNFGNPPIEMVNLPILKGTLSELPDELDAIIVASDLQGVVKKDGKDQLLGLALPEYLDLLIRVEFPTFDPQRIGIFLCGDLYANLEARGGLGDVRPVWLAFKQYFKWVVGVGGNHDAFGFDDQFRAFQQIDGIHFLKWNRIELDGLMIAGVSGILGTKRRPFRVLPDLYFTYLKKLLSRNPDFMLLHQSPNHPDLKVNGSPQIREILETSSPTIVCCGHSHWQMPYGAYTNGTQVLNMDARAMILCREG